MARSKSPLPIWENIAVTGWGANGKALAKVDGLVVFITGAVPGDTADLRITKKKSSYAEAEAIRINIPGPDRVEPVCAHFGTCGGCKWQDLRYEKQLEYKQQQVVDNLVRLGGLELPSIAPILASPRVTHYRNKLEFAGSAHRWFTHAELRTLGEITDRTALGFHIPGRFDKVMHVDTCHLQPEPSNSIRLFIHERARALGLPYYAIRENTGGLRTVLIRTTTTGETMTLVSFGQEDARNEQLLAAVHERFPDITSLLWTINTKKNDTIWDLDIRVFHGKDHITEALPDPGLTDLRFRIGAKSFFQTNPEQMRAMYVEARDQAGLTGHERVYDLYCGAGTISLFAARHCKEVIGAEIVPEAVADARMNAELNGIRNVRFEAGDLRHLLDASFIERNGEPDVLITDPPRAGMHEDVVARILEMAPPRIVYVSCNPATQARDLAMLKDRYRISHVRPVDMFPHTYHVENIVRLDRR
ncbi:MAG: 23S rRNA (uracil(1939)-C(5))-methyltransferase RlmD [Bacteroidetes bacterium]|nr:23S rRNA (uracil(1939)-C(5))-methyltransferase RlmD [Bacteroidota bacterium]MBX7130069.1 23S rRNA (uracil(1939)-C(5))-methyltransferase RlmD [Flavobacteriales bacterium]HMU15363.1 23S rRNA (uracil(1939)-C(5))-methyltransferase RlmD [Flavobacteriales bacterium]HNE79719.1 23S rRNA (uracil(1939)-C(5))-methyltransferase RlmD [Flavobacteriales bacterium]HNI03774.1 23S rRNA (uracil(1939)-C(5))-methyltransferase RlmD [Flavobacteriales bacterium]